MSRIFRGFVVFATFFLIQLYSAQPSVAQSFDYCKLQGSIYVEEKYPADAHFIVYLEKSEAFADLLVFKEENSLFADRAGLWFFTENRDFADFRVYFTRERKKADFSIYYTDIPSFAGCN